jgi:hypothetical protein
LTDDELIAGIRAVAGQVGQEFRSHWGVSAELFFSTMADSGPDPEGLRDAAVFVCDKPQDAVAGYHNANTAGVPYAFVFTEFAAALGRSWTVALSHEVLELLIDPDLNQLVVGPNPADSSKNVQFLKEICDPVQADSYAPDGIELSNFVTPAYFKLGASPTTTNQCSRSLQPFNVLAGGYCQFVVDGVLNVYPPGAMRDWRRKDEYAGKLRRQSRHLAVNSLARVGDMKSKKRAPASRKSAKETR